MIDKVKIIGLQRSGTTYLESLLEKNFRCYTYSNADVSICWKHALVNEDSTIIEGKEEYIGMPIINISSESNIMVIIIRKSFKSWVKSIRKSPVDLFKKRSDIKKESIDDLEKLHKDFYTNWIDTLSKTTIKYHVLEYEDILIDFKKELDIIKDFGLEQITIPFENILKVKQSSPFTEEMRENYIKIKQNENNRNN